ncbi:MAG: glycogen synthase [Bacillales bacterium]
MNILMVSSEANPFYKTGGLADVVYSLSKEYVNLKHNVSIILPYYKNINHEDFKSITKFSHINLKFNKHNYKTNIYLLKKEDINYFFIENDDYFNRENLYGYFDDGERFAFFSVAVCNFIKSLAFNFDIVHVHDWQSSIIPCLIVNRFNNFKQFKNIKTVLTIHNPLFKGYFDVSSLENFYNLPYYLFENGSIRLDNQVSTLKAGIFYANKITTVSPTHAFELTTPEGGKGLDYDLTLRQLDFKGILNGIDLNEFNPSKDEYIYKKYNKNIFIEEKEYNKKLFLDELNLEQNKPTYAVVSRLTSQKGLDLLIKMADFILYCGGNFILLGNGEKDAEQAFLNLRNKYPKNCYTYLGYSNRVAHKIYSGSDFLLMPSAFEPCGLSQMIAQEYGCLPIVRSTGGLNDTVLGYDKKLKNEEIANGFSFKNYDLIEALGTVSASLVVYDKKELLNKLKNNAIKLDHSWQNSVKEYISIYEELIKNN